LTIDVPLQAPGPAVAHRELVAPASVWPVERAPRIGPGPLKRTPGKAACHRHALEGPRWGRWSAPENAAEGEWVLSEPGDSARTEDAVWM